MKTLEKILVIFIIFIMIFSVRYLVNAVANDVVANNITNNTANELVNNVVNNTVSNNDLLNEKSKEDENKILNQVPNSEEELTKNKEENINQSDNETLKNTENDEIVNNDEDVKLENNIEKITEDKQALEIQTSSTENKEIENSINNNQETISENSAQKVQNSSDNINETQESQGLEVPTTQEGVFDDEDPLSKKYIKNVSPKLRSYRMVKPQEGIDTLISRFELEGTAAVGIDVSAWQENIDWSAVAASGVKFAMLRCGVRGATEGKITEDKYFKQNVQGAINNGIYVGVYFYSMAINEAEAVEEAEFVLNLINGYDIKYPVCYDFETYTDEFSSSGTPYRTNGLSTEQMNKNASAFLSHIQSRGYIACLYGSASYLKDTWDMNSFANYDTWVAHYYVSKPSYTGNYNLWQYTDNATVPGIKGAVDVDVDYTYYFRYHDVDITNYLFDSEYYADRYTDLRNIFGYDKNALKNHYYTCGIKEGRTASPVFDVRFYLNKYPDLKSAFGNNYEAAYRHFIDAGIKEGRQGSKYFDVSYYLDNNPDVKKVYYSSKTMSLVHFVLAGMPEGRRGSYEFYVKDYQKKVSEFYSYHLANNYKKYMSLDAGGDPVENYPVDITQYLFDSTYYADRYIDLKNIFGYNEEALKNHYYTCGIKEGRTASPVFDVRFYLNKYPDLKSAFGNNYEAAYRHFIDAGIKEGRQGSKYFDVKFYYSHYSDLRKIFGNNNTKLLMHFATSGVNEGREGSKEFSPRKYQKQANEFYRYQLENNYKKYIVLDAGGVPVENNPVDIKPYLFDSKYYADKYADLKNIFGYDEIALKIHYYTCGIKEGRTASPVFDVRYYLNKYADLKKVFGTNYVAAYEHFISSGIKEGRQGSENFDVKAYYNNYADLRKVFGNNYSKLLEHFSTCGLNEGRKGK